MAEVNGVSSVAVIASSTATGASFTGVDGNVQCADIGQATVGDGVIDTVATVEVSRRRIGVTAIGSNRDAATLGGGKGTRDDGERIAIEVGIVGIEVDGRGERRIFGGRNRIVDRHRRIVHGGDSDVERTDIGQAAVGDGVIDTVATVEVSGRRIGVTAIGSNGDTATLGGGKGTGDHAERIAIEIGIVGIEIDGRGKRRVFGRRNRIIDRHRRIVHGVDRNVQCTDIGQATVGDGVIDTVATVEVRGRGIGVTAVGGNGDTDHPGRWQRYRRQH